MTREARYVSDAVVDLLCAAGVDYVALNPGATFRGLHDSLVNHREDAPELVLCLHEEIAVSLAHGYAKAAGRPIAVLLHDVVGLQHAAMPIFNAWCDRAPMMLLGGTGPLSTSRRRPWIDWIHTALVQGQQVRDYVKWDDQPADADSIPMAFARAWRTAAADPPGPVYLCLDADLQEQELAGWPPDVLERHPAPRPPAPDPGAVRELAGWLRAAELPVLLTDYAGAEPAGFEQLVHLAEAAHVPVLERGARLSFPTWHELALPEEVLDDADAAIGLDVEDLHGALGGRRPPRIADVGVRALKLRSWTHDHQALPTADLSVTAGAVAAIEALSEALAAEPVPGDVLACRRERLAGRAEAARAAAWDRARAAEGDGALPPERLAAELWPLIEHERWVLAHGRPDAPERRLWRFEEPRQHLGWHGGGGLGHGPGAAIGAALAHGTDRLCLSLQPDGDLLYTPSALWTAARHRVPVLFVVQNNRQYQNTVEHAARMAEERGRPAENRYAAAGLRDPDVDFVALARSFGVWAAGPVSEPADLRAPVEEAIAVVKTGRPALVEVLTTGA